MKTFTLNQRDAEAMISVLNAVHPNASFVQDLIQQFTAQVEVAAEEVPAEDIKEVVEEAAEETPVVEEVEEVEEVVEEAPAKKAK
jgi:hypothetical protein